MANNAGMTLQEWVKKQRGRNQAIAQLVGVTPPVVSDWCTGKKAISSEHCKAIERLTDGEVSCREMRPNDWQKWWPEQASRQAATQSVAQGVA